MKTYRMEDYSIQYRIGRAMSTGTHEITRSTRREVKKYVVTYKTNAGELSPEEWKRIVRSCIEVSDSQELLVRIIDHCRTYCAWLKTEIEREEYAFDILVSRTYRYWEKFLIEGLFEKTAFIFIF